MGFIGKVEEFNQDAEVWTQYVERLEHFFEANDIIEEKPIAFASRSLSIAERKYAQVEKEGLAIIFGVKKFHNYLYGRHFEIISDHQPLKSLFNETRPVPVMASSRIQRWALTLSAYEYTITHKPGKNIVHADGLSRLPLPEFPKVTPVPGDVVCVLERLDQTPVTSRELRQWTDKDSTLSKVQLLDGRTVRRHLDYVRRRVSIEGETVNADDAIPPPMDLTNGAGIQKHGSAPAGSVSPLKAGVSKQSGAHNSNAPDQIQERELTSSQEFEPGLPPQQQPLERETLRRSERLRQKPDRLQIAWK
ncbi:uncharacterized protein LOC135101528 [Scylla paramamosain]|uniref:uncharacterized protein LOC135101528 n=1 Tax=Scylla paramamosain TaxID=85552 RepID=UPI003082C81C